MGVAIVSGVFALALALVSWLLTNGSKRTRLMGRIERQVAVLKDLPGEHPARAALDEVVMKDVAALEALPRSSDKARKWLEAAREVVSTLAAVFAMLLMGVAAWEVGEFLLSFAPWNDDEPSVQFIVPTGGLPEGWPPSGWPTEWPRPTNLRTSIPTPTPTQT